MGASFRKETFMKLEGEFWQSTAEKHKIWPFFRRLCSASSDLLSWSPVDPRALGSAPQCSFRKQTTLVEGSLSQRWCISDQIQSPQNWAWCINRLRWHPHYSPVRHVNPLFPEYQAVEGRTAGENSRETEQEESWKASSWLWVMQCVLFLGMSKNFGGSGGGNENESKKCQCFLIHPMSRTKNNSMEYN